MHCPGGTPEDDPAHSRTDDSAEDRSTADDPAADAGAQDAHGERGAQAEPGDDADDTVKVQWPWGSSRPSRADKVLLGFIIGLPLFFLVIFPLRPMLIAKAPLLLSVITGAKTVIAGAGAFAEVESFPLWTAILAGFIGAVKFDWLWWLAGHRWGENIVRMVANTPSTYRKAEWIRNLPQWLLIILVVFGRMPGVPGSLVWLVAGWSGMRFRTFITANIACALLVSTASASLGWFIGQPAVDLLKLIDKYAIWISLALIVGTVAWASWKERNRAAKKRSAGTAEEA